MQVNIALLTVTDTRTLETDKSGSILVKKIILRFNKKDINIKIKKIGCKSDCTGRNEKKGTKQKKNVTTIKKEGREL